MIIPKIQHIEKISFSNPEEIILKNNIKLYGFNGAKNDILRIDLIFDAGRWSEEHPNQAEFVAKLLKSGTALHNSFEINEFIDGLGSTIKTSVGYNTITVSIFCMNKYLEQTLAYAILCLNDCIFHQNEIDYQKRKSRAKLKLALEKNDYIADVTFRKLVFGENHPYGYETTESKIDALTQAQFFDYYDQNLTPEKCNIFAAGKYGDKEIKIIDNLLGNWDKPKAKQDAANTKTPVITSSSEKIIHIKKEKSVQASIVIGKQLFNRHHEDYAAFVLLNTILGGYFGSRLMSNIREEKGLTYGIHSSLAALKHNGIFSIQTDTNLENKDLCLHEIYLELDRLKNELIPDEEINLARNYLLGKFLSRTDGAFNKIEVFKSFFIENIEIHKFEEIVETIRHTNALSLQILAQKYLQKDSMFEVIVG